MVHVFVMLQWHWSVQSLSKIRRNDNKFLFNKSKKIEHRNNNTIWYFIFSTNFAIWNASQVIYYKGWVLKRAIETYRIRLFRDESS